MPTKLSPQNIRMYFESLIPSRPAFTPPSDAEFLYQQTLFTHLAELAREVETLRAEVENLKARSVLR